MSAIYILIGISILVGLIFLVLFIWSVKSGQYDDTHSPPIRMLIEKTKKRKK